MNPVSKGPSGGSRPTEAIARLTELLRELGELLGPARGDKAEWSRTLAAGAGTELEHQLQDAARRLEQMAELVHAAMQSASHSIGSPHLSRARPATLGEAVQHAADVLAPLAARNQVHLEVEVTPPAAVQPAGGLYTVVLNGLQNAIEAVSRRGGPGHVKVTARADAAPTGVGYGRDNRSWFQIEITDDGVGAPPDLSRVFDLGYSTKHNGAGVGLAVARGVVQGMGGMIDLKCRLSGGCALVVRFPSLTSSAVGSAA